MRASSNWSANHIGGIRLEPRGTSTMASSTALPPSSTVPPPPPRPTVSLDPTPVLIPLLSSIICFPIVALAVICALRYRALRLRRKEHLRRLRGGGIRAARLEIPGSGGEKPSFFSRDSSSGDTTSRPPHNNIEEDRRGTVVPVSSSSSSGDEDFASDLATCGKSGAGGRRASRRRSSSVKFGAVAAILHVPGVPSPRSGSPTSPRAGSPRSASVSFFPEPSFIHDVVNDYDDDADDEDDLAVAAGGGDGEGAKR